MMAELSENARVVLGSSFSFGQVLTYHMIKSVPSPEMHEALNELVNAGMLIEERGLPDMTMKAVRYRLADGIDVTPFRKEAMERIEHGDAPSIRIFIPKHGAA